MTAVDPRYLETFRRHRVLLCAPVVLALITSVWTVVGTPKSYRSGASVWFDNAPPAPSSQTQTDPTIRPPATQRQLILDELLATRQFRVNIGRRGPLSAYLAANPSPGHGPLALLSEALGGRVSLDERVVAALDRAHVATTVLGPQVLGVSLEAGSPTVAAETLTALLDEFVEQEGVARKAQAAAAAVYYTDLVAEASKAATDAQKDVTTYIAAHPVRSDNDPSLTTLTQAAAVAATRLSDATSNLNQAAVNLNHLSDTSVLRYLDKPIVPPGPVGGHKKKLVLAAGGGGVAGGIVSLVGILLLTFTRSLRTDRRQLRDTDRADSRPPSDPALPISTGTDDEQPLLEPPPSPPTRVRKPRRSAAKKAVGEPVRESATAPDEEGQAADGGTPAETPDDNEASASARSARNGARRRQGARS